MLSLKPDQLYRPPLSSELPQREYHLPIPRIRRRLLLWSSGLHSAALFTHSIPDSEHHYFMSSTAKVAIDYPIPKHHFFVREYPVQLCVTPVHPSSICIKMLFQTPSENLLDYLCSSVLAFQWMSGRLKFPTRSRICDPDISLSCFRKATSNSSCWLDGH